MTTKTSKVKKKKGWAIIEYKNKKLVEVMLCRGKPNVFTPDEFFVPCTITYSPTPKRK